MLQGGRDGGGLTRPPHAAPFADSPLARCGRRCWLFLCSSEFEALLLEVVHFRKPGIYWVTVGSRISLDLSAERCPCGNKCSVGVEAAIGMTSRNATREDELSGAELDSCVLGTGEKNRSLL